MTRLEPPEIGQRILTRDDGATIAYCVDSGGSSPGVMFCCGFRSDKTATAVVEEAFGAGCVSLDLADPSFYPSTLRSARCRDTNPVEKGNVVRRHFPST